MDDIKVVKSTSDKPKKQKKTVTIKMSRNVFVAIIAVIILFVVFFLGKSYGASQQKKTDTKTNPFSAANRNAELPQAIANRWTSIGTITAVSDSSISVKDARDQTKTAAINKDTKIVDRLNKTLTTKDLKNGQRIIISGTKDAKDQSKLTATRIRLEQ